MDKEEFDQWDAERKRRRADREARRAERRWETEDRKDRVLHTRISEGLDETLRHAANELRVPVSNLVRNVLEDVFDVVETVTSNVEELVEDIREEASQARDRFRGQRAHSGRARTGRSSRREGRARDWDVDTPPRRAEPAAESAEPAEAAERAEAEERAEPLEPVEERAPFPDVVGWQPLVLNRSQQCADCGRDLLRGDRGYMGLGPDLQATPYLCEECLHARS